MGAYGVQAPRASLTRNASVTAAADATQVRGA